MSSASRWVWMVAGGVVLICAGRVAAQDWPQWRGTNRDGKVSGFAAPQTWPQQLTQRWRVIVGAGDATPALVGDRLYAFGRQDANEVVLCLDAAAGKVLWEDRYPADFVVTGPAARHPGPRGSLAVADGKVCSLGVGGILSCLDAATGKVLWRKKSVEDYGGVDYRFDSSMSPFAGDGLCVVHVGGKGKGAILALDLASGRSKWKWEGDAPANSSPVAMTVQGAKQIVTFTAKALVGLSLSDGKLLWQVPFELKNVNNITPVVDGDTVICIVEGKGLMAYRIEKQGDASAAVSLWANAELGARFTTPVLKDGLLYGYGNTLYCASAKTGETLWADSARRGQTAALVDAGPCLVALTGNSELVAFKPNDKEYAELARIQFGQTETWAHPILAGKRIFVRDQTTVTLWTLD